MIKRINFGIVLIIILLLSACSKLPIETNMSEEVADFSFTNEHEESVSLDDLKGDWWIADFVFTNCTTVCLPMTSNMTALQNKMDDQDVSVQLVSFSVDPDYDTPEVLKEYGESYEADFDTWDFLTGYDFETVKKLSIKSFRSLVKEPEYGDDQVTHGTLFYLVNPEGEIVKSYDGQNAENMDDILEDLKKLKDKEML